ncbi:MAG: 3-oxoacyl-ACP reductase FabG [Gammaproteobacteria bacterium]
MKLNNQVALVTGASRGIGRAIARTLGANGAVVVGTATSASGVEAISEDLRQHSIQGLGMQLDVREPDNIETVVESINTQFGAVGILVNNAGVTRDNLLLRMKDEDWSASLSTNLSSVYRLCKACLRGMMRARTGRIISITSVVGMTGNAGQSNYAAAKAGILGFSKSLAREVAGRGITVNTVAPGFIDTDMTRAIPEAQRNALLQQIPIGRFGRADDVAEAVLFLASPAAAYITGETLNVNGGMYMP